MVLKIFGSFWSSKSYHNRGADLIDKLDALERQLRSYADDARIGEETPLFDDITNEDSRGASKSATDQTEEDSRNTPDYAESSTENDLSRFEYSYKPLRIAAQLFRDLVLFLKIGIVWLLDRWYRWLFVALPPSLYVTAYKFMTRKDDASADVIVTYLVTFLVLLALTMAVSAAEMHSSRRTSLLSNR